jgi:leader peptidase (prepilin peptidase)/N-methyltransferase
MVILLFILGLCVGSFLNVLADRLPRGEDVIKSRSHCEYCKHKLLWYELIPVLSFLFQKGKSRCCHTPLPFQYPISELATGFGFAVIFCFKSSVISFGTLFSPQIFYSQFFILTYLVSIILFSSLLVIFISDLKYEIIPMEMIIIGFIAVFCFHFLHFTDSVHFIPYPLSFLGAGLFFFCLWFFSKGKAMGDGDIYLAALLGLYLGFPAIIIALYGAFLTGAIAGIILILVRKKSMKAHIPFGPFLIIGFVIANVWGERIIKLWMSLI